MALFLTLPLLHSSHRLCPPCLCTSPFTFLLIYVRLSSPSFASSTRVSLPPASYLPLDLNSPSPLIISMTLLWLLSRVFVFIAASPPSMFTVREGREERGRLSSQRPLPLHPSPLHRFHNSVSSFASVALM